MIEQQMKMLLAYPDWIKLMSSPKSNKILYCSNIDSILIIIIMDSSTGLFGDTKQKRSVYYQK